MIVVVLSLATCTATATSLDQVRSTVNSSSNNKDVATLEDKARDARRAAKYAHPLLFLVLGFGVGAGVSVKISHSIDSIEPDSTDHPKADSSSEEKEKKESLLRTIVKQLTRRLYEMNFTLEKPVLAEIGRIVRQDSTACKKCSGFWRSKRKHPKQTRRKHFNLIYSEVRWEVFEKTQAPSVLNQSPGNHLAQFRVLIDHLGRRELRRLLEEEEPEPLRLHSGDLWTGEDRRDSQRARYGTINDRSDGSTFPLRAHEDPKYFKASTEAKEGENEEKETSALT